MDKRNKEILKIALPSIVSNITVPLLGLVDVAIVGHLGAAAYIGAIAVGGMMFNVMYWIFGFLRMGTSGMTSQALGRRDLCEVTRLLARSVGIAFAVAAALILLQKPLLAAALGIMQPTEEVARLASVYFLTLIYGAPAMLGLFSLSGWFIGMQNSRSPMAVAIVQNVVNICASTFLVFGCGMKVEGVAFGTLTAQYAGFIMAVALCWKHYRRLRAYFSWQGVWRRDDMRRFFSVNRDIFLRTLCMVSVMLFFTSAGSWQGEVVLAVNTLLMQFYLLFSYVMDGFAYAGEALSGRYFGARNAAALRDTVRHLFRWGFLGLRHRGRRFPVAAHRRAVGRCGITHLLLLGTCHSAGRNGVIRMGRDIHRLHHDTRNARLNGRSRSHVLRRIFHGTRPFRQPRAVGGIHNVRLNEGNCAVLYLT